MASADTASVDTASADTASADTASLVATGAKVGEVKLGLYFACSFSSHRIV